MFNKISCIIVVSLVLFSEIVLATNEDKIGGYVTVQSELVNLREGESFLSNDVNSYLTKGGKLGAGLNVNFIGDHDYFKIKPFTTWLVGGNLKLVGGFSLASPDCDHIHGGFEYFRSLSKEDSIFISVSYYLGLNEESGDFLDSFLEIKHDFGNKFALSLEIVYDHLPECENDWMLIGPVLHYKLSDRLDIFGRIAAESDLENWNNAVDMRVGFNWSF